MSEAVYTKVKGSDKSAHQHVEVGGKRLGEVWREQVSVTVSKIAAPRKTALRWRWFAKLEGDSKVIGRGTRVAMLLGAGFPTKDEAVGKLTSEQTSSEVAS